MIFTTFINEIKERVQRKLGEEAEVRLRSVLKNNGVLLWGIAVTRQGENISPTIYLENYYDAFVSGMDLDEIVDAILYNYHNIPMKMSVNMDFFKDFEKVKARIAYRLLHLERNKALLGDVPFIPYLDLAICFYYAFEDMAMGEGAILIRRSHMEMWNTNVEELFRLAQENTPRLFPPEIVGMQTIMEQLLEAEDMKVLKASEQANMYVLTNQKRIQGAAVLLYPELLEGLARKLDNSFYIIPSSVHEVILVPFHKDADINSMKRMIQEVNDTQVEPEDVLSGSLYAYDRKDKRIINL